MNVLWHAIINGMIAIICITTGRFRRMRLERDNSENKVKKYRFLEKEKEEEKG